MKHLFLSTLAFSGLLVFGARAANSPRPAAVSTNTPVILTANAEWIPLRTELDIEPGSALDFSTMGFVDAPAGKHGRVIARQDGQFAFADSPDKPRRFYGVNLCFSAHYLSKEEADRLAERLLRLGYNALRFHHYENELTQGQTNTTTLNPAKLDQFDYLMAALIQRGIYLTTDLYVSRSVPWREIGVEREGRVPMDTFKFLVPVHEGAFENWKAFSRALLTHVNPYTKRSYAQEPALAWLAMINEGNLGNFYKEKTAFPEWKQKWNQWLSRRYQNRQALAEAWGKELGEQENPAQQTVAMPESLSANTLRARDAIAFLADTERGMVMRMRAFLRDELGCKALISNANSWTRFATDQSARAVYDYVDDHFYVDHPQFLQQSWRLPSRCPNTSPLSEGASGGRSITFTRLFDKPFTVTEYNYSAPGRFRGVGGILTGAMGALQGWGGIWRFAYSHSRQNIAAPSPLGYFDMATDPLGQAAERASLCLFLRGDLQMAPHSVGLVMTDADLAKPAAKIPTLAPKWHWLAWVTRVGTQVIPSPDATLAQDLIFPLAWQTPASAYKPGTKVLAADPYALDNDKLVSAVIEKKIIDESAAPNPTQKIYRSETGEVTIDAPKNVLVLDSARSAGGFAPANQTIQTTKGGVRITMRESDATVWVSALDQTPIQQSRRLLVTHLTDLQNTGIKYAEPARQTLLEWGRLPHLVRAGKADISIRLQSPGQYHVWALAPSGKRVAEVPATTGADTLQFMADVGADPGSGARMLYEVAVK